MHGPTRKTGSDLDYTSLDHLPIGSEEIFLHSEAVVGVVRCGPKAFVARLLVPLDDVSSYEEACQGVSEVIHALINNGRRGSRGDPFEG